MNEFAVKVLFHPIKAYVDSAAGIGAVIGVLLMGLVGIPLSLIQEFHISIVRAVLAGVVTLIFIPLSLRTNLSCLAIGAYIGAMLLLVGWGVGFMGYLSLVLALVAGGIVGAALAVPFGAIVGLIKSKRRKPVLSV